MKHLLIGTTLAVMAVTTIRPAQAQMYPVPAASPPPAYYGSTYRYPFPALSPEDAYRQGLINRWELQQYAGPLPPALQGPSVNGDKGASGGGRGGGE
jgi:hypothetical protein